MPITGEYFSKMNCVRVIVNVKEVFEGTDD